MTETAFVYLSAVAVLSGAATVFLRSPIHSALSLVLTVFHVAGLLVIMGSGFLGVLNVLVYAGAIIVLFLFTMMLLNLHQQEDERYLHRYQTWLGIPLGGLLLIEAVWVARRPGQSTARPAGSLLAGCNRCRRGDRPVPRPR